MSNKVIELFIKDGFIRHKHDCFMGEFNSIIEPDSKGCDCGLSKALALLAEPCVWKEIGNSLQGMCKTGCGHTYTKQHYEFCHFCGKVIKESK